MTLDEMIKYAEEAVDFCEDLASKCDMTDALESCMAYKDSETAERYRQIAEWLKELKRLTALSNAIQDTVEELNHIATEPYDVDDYQEGVTDGIQLAIRTINKKINERTNSGGNVTNEEIEEAIDLLDNLIGMVEDNHKSDYDKAIKMGIEALKRLSNINDNERR